MTSAWRFALRRSAAAIVFVSACIGDSCWIPEPNGKSIPAVEPSFTADVVVDFESAAAADRPLLLYSGKRANACQVFEPHVGNGTSLVKLVDLGWDSACAVEVTVFVKGHGAFGRAVDPNVPADKKWITDAMNAGGLSLAFPALTHLPVRLWLWAQTSDLVKVKAQRDRVVSSAFSVFEELATGITLDTSSVVQAPPATLPSCVNADQLSTNSQSYDASKLNVYFVDKPVSLYAASCWMEGHPEIMFVSWSNVNTPSVALAHELGHALGLVHPKAATALEIGGGHTNDVAGFAAHDFNLMLSGGGTVTNISVGQLYEMNFGEDSWLNRSGSPFKRTVVHPCQDIWGAGKCPALTMFQTSWPP